MKRGWCPTLHVPMATGDGMLVRVKPPAARLLPAQARALAAAAERFGNGTVELTQRGNLQLRGLRPDSAAPFAAAMVDAGLADPDPAREARRCVVPAPLCGDDPGVAPGTEAMTLALEAAFAGDARLAGLPPKFAVAVDGGGVLGGRPVAADLVAWTDGTRRELRPARRGAGPAPAGFLPYPGTGTGAFGCAPPFGETGADALRQLAAVAERFGTAIRVTPWRALMLGRIEAGAPAAAGLAGALAAFITDPADPRLLVTACPGAPHCASGSVPARTDATRLRPGGPVHVSGCAKGCAHPGPAAAVLVGRGGRYDLVRNGRAGDVPAATGLSLEEAMALL